MAPSVVLITGCSTGMGLATAVHLATKSKHDFKVYATMRNLAKKGQLETAAGETLEKTLFIRELDVTKNDTITSLVDEIVRDNGRIDVVFNNAGFSVFDDYFMGDEPLDAAKTMMDTNVWGPTRVMQAVLPVMKKQKSGRIINTTSGEGIEGYPFHGFYSASKFALQGLSENLSPILRQVYNIKLSVLVPGPVYNPSFAIIMDPAFKPEYICGKWDSPSQEVFLDYWQRDMQPIIQAYQQPEEVAELVERIILSEDPYVRYPTGSLIAKRMADQLIDPTGNVAGGLYHSFKQ
ncbi:retinol dehydrogenase 8-like [Patiria miniata]|uniref:Uncharacterized protein n=1 Tax=Patiria miniata TaxID=46514 RepID=A0A913Z331_PATMI|nr:retinol dehydrogenase 8-like [Patiria miniata]